MRRSRLCGQGAAAGIAGVSTRSVATRIFSPASSAAAASAIFAAECYAKGRAGCTSGLRAAGCTLQADASMSSLSNCIRHCCCQPMSFLHCHRVSSHGFFLEARNYYRWCSDLALHVHNLPPLLGGQSGFVQVTSVLWVLQTCGSLNVIVPVAVSGLLVRRWLPDAQSAFSINARLNPETIPYCITACKRFLICWLLKSSQSRNRGVHSETGLNCMQLQGGEQVAAAIEKRPVFVCKGLEMLPDELLQVHFGKWPSIVVSIHF